jgi:hypothetical protein
MSSAAGNVPPHEQLTYIGFTTYGWVVFPWENTA